MGSTRKSVGPPGRDDKLHQDSGLPHDRTLSFQRSLLATQNKTEQSNFIEENSSTESFPDLDRAWEMEIHFLGLQMRWHTGKVSVMGCGEVTAVCGPLSQMVCHRVEDLMGRTGALT